MRTHLYGHNVLTIRGLAGSAIALYIIPHVGNLQDPLLKKILLVVDQGYPVLGYTEY